MGAGTTFQRLKLRATFRNAMYRILMKYKCSAMINYLFVLGRFVAHLAVAVPVKINMGHLTHVVKGSYRGSRFSSGSGDD